MFRDLLESRRVRRRRTGIAAASAVAHAVAIAIAAAATRHAAASPASRTNDTTLVYHAPPPAIAHERLADGVRTAGPTSSARPPRPGDSPVGPGRISVDLTITVPTLGTAAAAATEPIERSPRGGGGAAAAGPDGAYRVVERAATPLPGAPLARYPETLRQLAVEGEALLRFVVDSTGRVEPASVVTVRASHPPFADAARRALLATRFSPAEVGGRRVRQLVEQSFSFALDR